MRPFNEDQKYFSTRENTNMAFVSELKTKSTLLKPLSLAIYLALTGTVCLSTQITAANSSAGIDYHIPAGDLDKVLNQFAVQSGIALSTEGHQLQGLKSHGLTGTYSIEQGFQLLLAETPFHLIKKDAGYILVEKTTVASRDMGQLKPIDVWTNEHANQITQLPVIQVQAEQTGSAEDGYLAKKVKQVGPWGAKDLQDTPYSMTVMSSSLIENAIAGDMDQIYKMNPIAQNSGPSTVYGTQYAVFRGFGTESGLMDGLPLSSSSTGIAMEELDRVEIINGLTGFMYGASSSSGGIGGTTNYVLKRPTYSRLSDFTVGNYGNQQWFAHIDLGNKIDDAGAFAYRFNASYQNGETGKSEQNIERALISGSLDWNVNDALLIQLEAAHTEYHLDGIDSRFYAYKNSSYASLDYWLAPLDNDKTYTPDWTYLDIETDRIGLNLKYKINDIFSFRTAYIYKKDKQESLYSYPAYFEDSGFFNGWPSIFAPSEQIAQGGYAYLDSVFKTGNIQHKLIVGISGDILDSKRHEISSIEASNSAVYSDPEDLMTWAKPAVFYADTDWGEMYTSSTSSHQNLIIGDDIIFNPQWSALVGINYATVRADNYTIAGLKSSQYKESKLTPTLSILYKPLENLTTYITYIEALQQGEIVSDDASLYNNPGEVLEPYVSHQYEIGAKYAFSDRLLLSTALFRIEKANSYDTTTSDGKITRSQDGEQIHQGLELTLTGKITDNLTVITGGSVMDASVEKAENSALEGKQPTGVSDILAKIYSEYKIPQIEGLMLTGGAYYTGSKYKDSANLMKISGYTIYDLGARYQTKIRSIPISFNFNIANLTDKSYWSTIYSLGIPRTFSFSVKTSF
jgi:iron complex outermembrane receptor protein